MPKRGRPKLPGCKRRDKPLCIRLTDAERATIEIKAFLAGKEPSSWAREQLLKIAKRVK
jgi:hypothetical protein